MRKAILLGVACLLVLLVGGYLFLWFTAASVPTAESQWMDGDMRVTFLPDDESFLDKVRRWLGITPRVRFVAIK